jgi:formate hydrogenlyase subunit 5
MRALDRARATPKATTLAHGCSEKWSGRVAAELDPSASLWRIACQPTELLELCQWLTEERGYAFATLVVEEKQPERWSLTYVFYDGADSPWAHVQLQIDGHEPTLPSLVGLAQGPSVDWHEREAEDLFGLRFEGHPRLGEFVLHEDWPEGINPMRRAFDASGHVRHREREPSWQPPIVVEAPGSFAMPVGPVFSDFAEAAHFLLETVGEDVIHTIPRFFYKYRGVEKIAEGQSVDRVLLLAERFSGNAAFAHGLAFCQAIETICAIDVPARAQALRTVIGELERLRHHAAVITGICNSTALAVATSQASLIEEDLLRLSGEVARHRYFFGVVEPGGMTIDFSPNMCRRLAAVVAETAERLSNLQRSLVYSSSFLDRLEEVGFISEQVAISYGLVGPIARASGLARDLRKLRPYAAYDMADFDVPTQQEGDGYARQRIFFGEALQSASIVRQVLSTLPDGEVRSRGAIEWRAGVSLGIVEAPAGAAFHWVRLRHDGTVARYRVTPPSFANWHGFHFAAENFAFQDFPIILASFGLSNAECDR